MNWVQCDGCERWFHLLCVGLKDDQVNNDEDYMCFDCCNKQNNSPTAASQSGHSVPNGRVKQEVESAGEEDLCDPGSSREDSQLRVSASVPAASTSPCHDPSGDGEVPMEVEVLVDMLTERAPAVETVCSDSPAMEEGEEEEEEEQEVDKVEEVVEEVVAEEAMEEDGVDDEEDDCKSRAASSASQSACDFVCQSLSSETRESSVASAIENVPS